MYQAGDAALNGYSTVLYGVHTNGSLLVILPNDNHGGVKARAPTFFAGEGRRNKNTSRVQSVMVLGQPYHGYR
jgi:hypothetical protein